MDGDKDFEKFLENQNQGSAPFFVMLTIREKMNGVLELYKSTLDAALKVSDQALKKKLNQFCEDLIEASKQTIDQFDYLIADSLELDEDDDDEKDGPK